MAFSFATLWERKGTDILFVKGCRQRVRLVFNLNVHFSPHLLLGSEAFLKASDWLPERAKALLQVLLKPELSKT